MDNIVEKIARLSTIEPRYATLDDIDEGCRILDTLSPDEIGTRVALLSKLGSFFIEVETGNPNHSIRSAKGCYEELLTIAAESGNQSWLIAGLSGSANTLSREFMLNFDPEVFNDADEIFSHLIAKCDELGMLQEANSNRINYAALLTKGTHGDRYALYSRSIALLRQVISSSSQEALGANFNPSQYGRSLFNLGAALMQQSDDPHVQTLNLNEAVRCFQLALLFRPADVDPKGRAKVLRALAMLLPEWTGADSLAHADWLANRAIAEAEELEGRMTAPEQAGWSIVKQSRSALDIDLDSLAQDRSALITLIEVHRRNIALIIQDELPYLWAEWTGGYARLIGRIAVEDGNAELGNLSSNTFEAAIAAISEDRNPRLFLALHREFGRLCHQFAFWEKSLDANKKVADIGLHLANTAATSVSRANELENITRATHFATFAAAQLGLAAEAVELAEMGRANWMNQALLVASIRMSAMPQEFKDAVVEAQSLVLELELRESELLKQGSIGIAATLQNHLGIALGDLIKMGAAGDPKGADARMHKDLADVRVDLMEAHRKMDALLNNVSAENIFVKRLSFAQIQDIAKTAGFPLVYLLSTAWGTIALIVSKGGEIIQIPQLNREDLKDLLYGENGYLHLSAGVGRGDLDASLEIIEKTLDQHLSEPLAAWCKERQQDTIGIIGLGEIGLLPLQLLTISNGLNMRLAPSARAINLRQPHRRSSFKQATMMTVGGLTSNRLRPLPFGRIESLYLQKVCQTAGATVRSFDSKSTLTDIEDELIRSTHLHFSCHGSFAPFSPLNSMLYLEGDEVLPVYTLLRPALKLINAELVILSACNSASAEERRTPDEVIGFPAAFLAAGAKTVIAAQWPVSESATFLLMHHFYEEFIIKGLDPAISLSNAQRWLKDATVSEISKVIASITDSLGNGEMRSKRLLSEFVDDIKFRGSEFPFRERSFWAAFVCVGG